MSTPEDPRAGAPRPVRRGRKRPEGRCQRGLHRRRPEPDVSPPPPTGLVHRAAAAALRVPRNDPRPARSLIAREKLADFAAKGFIVVAPDAGRQREVLAGLGRECGARDRGCIERGCRSSSIASSAARRRTTRSTRTACFAAGHSAGGIFTNRLLRSRSKVLAGGIVGSGVFDFTAPGGRKDRSIRCSSIVTWGGDNDTYKGTTPNGVSVPAFSFVEQASLASKFYDAEANIAHARCRGDDLGPRLAAAQRMVHRSPALPAEGDPRRLALASPAPGRREGGMLRRLLRARAAARHDMRPDDHVQAAWNRVSSSPTAPSRTEPWVRRSRRSARRSASPRRAAQGACSGVRPGRRRKPTPLRSRAS